MNRIEIKIIISEGKEEGEEEKKKNVDAIILFDRLSIVGDIAASIQDAIEEACGNDIGSCEAGKRPCNCEDCGWDIVCGACF